MKTKNKNARIADKIGLFGHLRRFDKIVLGINNNNLYYFDLKS